MARQSCKDLLERMFYAAKRLTELSRNLSDHEDLEPTLRLRGRAISRKLCAISC